jgi:hypothetical protein
MAGSGLNIKDIRLRENLVFFGGNILPTDSLALTIGRITFLSDSSLNQYPFSSYIFQEDFQSLDQTLTDNKVFNRNNNLIRQPISIYPNPTSTGYTIDIFSEKDENVNLSAVNQVGQIVFTDVLPLAKGNNRYYMAKSETWVEGLYYIELKSENVNHKSKLIKIK